ncbi:hypothetical protein OHB26_14350 [Nocardia sp. NBC_01503]|uniref:hypothetical protein n=1 Tax=Nocardia sp. NBC_01503 TaxID=2975997 RepID=UPI002E7B5D6A|nr:hypothetical protein [Nocardia sp. NBC_01503]WTL35266.1 hypothetical protein OHB26_14350 [Nocardia sp. NBC_01503]
MRRRSIRRAASFVAAGLIIGAGTVGFGTGAGSADTGDRTLTLRVHSAAMDRDIEVKVRRPADASGPRPVLYLLNGAGGGSDIATWWRNTDVGGDDDDPAWAASDPVLNAEMLRGTKLFISDSSGLPGPHDRIDDGYLLNPTPLGLANQLMTGGVIEAAVNWCTQNLRNRLNELGIPATYDFQAAGTHSWGYWRDAFHRSWPVLADGLGLPE